MGVGLRAVFVEKIKAQTSAKYDWVRIGITEGKNRQIKKMFEKIGFDVKKLKRVAIGQLKLGNLKSGTYAPLSQFQVKKIFTVPKVSTQRELKKPVRRSTRKKKISKKQQNYKRLNKN